MKTKLFWSAVAFCLATAFGIAARAANYSIDWFKISSGGGASTGGSFALTGTAGQLDTGVLAGGGYTLTAGFWSVDIAVQTSGAPILAIARMGSNVQVMWPSSGSAGYALEYAGALGQGTTWAAQSGTVSDNGTTKSMTVPVAPGQRFFRLRK